MILNNHYYSAFTIILFIIVVIIAIILFAYVFLEIISMSIEMDYRYREYMSIQDLKDSKQRILNEVDAMNIEQPRKGDLIIDFKNVKRNIRVLERQIKTFNNYYR